MDQITARYDLRTEPWIPVERMDGTQATVSIRNALCEAHRIRHISGEIPGENIALLRLLLALIYCIYEIPEHMGEEEKRRIWRELWESGAFPADRIDSYLVDFPMSSTCSMTSIRSTRFPALFIWVAKRNATP